MEHRQATPSSSSPQTPARRACRRGTRAAAPVRAAARVVVESLEVRRLLSAGQLDPTFGVGGKVTTDLGPGATSDWVSQFVLTQPGGKVLVAGLVGDADVYKQVSAVVRYNSDGTLDATFGSGGKVRVNDFQVAGVTVEADGRILLAGASSASPNGMGADFAAARLNPDGSLDATFGGGDGRVAVDFTGEFGYEGARRVLVRPDGRIVLAGTTYDFRAETGADLAVAQLNPDGTPDETFGGGAGRVVIDVGGAHGDDDLVGATVLADGKIVLGGTAFDYRSGTDEDFAAVRLNPDGTPDASFGADGDGHVTMDFTRAGGAPFRDDRATAFAVQADGKIVIAGFTFDSWSNTNYDFAAARLNADGSIDAGFGGHGDGWASVDFAAAGEDTTDVAQGLTVAPDGRIVIAGYTTDPYGTPTTRTAAARLNPDGTLDPTFGDGGRLTVDFDRAFDGALGVAVAGDDGALVLAGTAPGSRTGMDFAVVRLGADGGLDPTFGDGGRVTTDVGGGATQDAAAQVLAVGPDGELVMAGTVYSVGGSAWGVARYRADGTLDDGFGAGGRLRLDLRGDGVLTGLAVQADGKVLLAGYARDPLTGGADFAVVRLNADGSLDANFGGHGDGRATFDLAGGDDFATGIAVAADGRIVLGGHAYEEGAGETFAALRLNADGTADTAFGGRGDGWATVDFSGPGWPDVATAVAVQADGRVVLAGYAYNYDPDTGYDFAAVRLNADGSLDAGFGVDGRTTVDFPGGSDFATALAVQADGTILLGGYTYGAYYATDTGTDFAVARLRPDGTLDTSFGEGDGWVTVDFGGAGVASYDTLAGLDVQADGKIVLAGNTYDWTQTDFAAARLNADGTIDTSFGDRGDGRMTVDFGTGGARAEEVAAGVAVHPGGGIVLAGYTSDPAAGTAADFALVRLQGDAPPNRAPTAGDDALGGTEDTPLVIDPSKLLANDADPDAGQTLRVIGVAATPDTHGTVAIDPESGRITYTPEPNYHGPASFTYTVDDGHGGTATATATVSVAAVNDAPTAVGGTYHVAEDGSVIVDLRQLAGDVETAAADLVYTIVGQPTRGQLTPVAGQNGVFRYTPGAGADGALDSFAFTVTDAGDGADAPKTSGPATVSLAVDRYAGVSRDAAGVLRVGLTDGSDAVILDRGVLYVNGSAVSLAGVTEVRVWARGGNDLVSLDGLTVPAQVFAGAGNDAVAGGSGSDLILGGAGDDSLAGGEGDDLLLGGGGQDRLYGLGGNDVLAADDFGPTATVAQLRQLQSLWADRQITAADAQAADALFESDGGADVLTGGNGADWFILGTADRITDLSRAAGNAPNSGDQVTYL